MSRQTIKLFIPQSKKYYRIAHSGSVEEVGHMLQESNSKELWLTSSKTGNGKLQAQHSNVGRLKLQESLGAISGAITGLSGWFLLSLLHGDMTAAQASFKFNKRDNSQYLWALLAVCLLREISTINRKNKWNNFYQRSSIPK